MHLAEETSVTLPRMTGPASALQKVEQWLGSIVAAVAALLVIAEIVVLFSGVSARYLVG
jgi:TRAP-type C4-dicarboxylate transport system permease small subunit